jgi:hypothetical protein
MRFRHAVAIVKIGLLTLVLAVAGCTNNAEKRSNDAGNPAPSATHATPAPTTQPSFPAPNSSPQSSAAPGAGVIQSQDTNSSGVVGELTECRRSEGVLTIKVRFRNTSNQGSGLVFTNWNGSEADNPKFYVTAGEKKYFMLKDSDGTYLSSNSANANNGLSIHLEPGQAFLWWAKYPAPAAEAKKINFVTPLAPPFEDIPITDK